MIDVLVLQRWSLVFRRLALSTHLCGFAGWGAVGRLMRLMHGAEWSPPSDHPGLWAVKHPSSSPLPVSSIMASRSWSETCGGALGGFNRLSHVSRLKGTDVRACSAQKPQKKSKKRQEMVKRCCPAFPPAAAPQIKHGFLLELKGRPPPSSSWILNLASASTILSFCRPPPTMVRPDAFYTADL